MKPEDQFILWEPCISSVVAIHQVAVKIFQSGRRWNTLQPWHWWVLHLVTVLKVWDTSWTWNDISWIMNMCSSPGTTCFLFTVKDQITTVYCSWLAPVKWISAICLKWKWMNGRRDDWLTDSWVDAIQSGELAPERTWWGGTKDRNPRFPPELPSPWAHVSFPPHHRDLHGMHTKKKNLIYEKEAAQILLNLKYCFM